MPIRFFAAGIFLGIAIFAGTASRAAECDCTNLSILQVELRNALRVQAAYRGQIAALRGMSVEASQDTLGRFAVMAAHANLEADGSGTTREVEYVPYGIGVDVGLYDTLGPGQTPQQRREQLCAMRASSAAALSAAVDAARCSGIGRAIRAHEAVHVAMCRGIGFRAYYAMHGSDRAAEEVQAYAVQIAALRAEIIRVLERLNPRIEVMTSVRMTPPANPLYRALVTEVEADLRMTRAVVVDANAPLVRFEGQGRQNSTSRVEGNCRFTAGMPIVLPITGGVETDGLEARITYAVSGTTPTLAMQCQVPGGGRGMGMTMPVPISGGPPGAINLPLRNGAEEVTDMANTPAAAMMAQAGARLSGQGRFRLVFDCPAR